MVSNAFIGGLALTAFRRLNLIQCCFRRSVRVGFLTGSFNTVYNMLNPLRAGHSRFRGKPHIGDRIGSSFAHRSLLHPGLNGIHGTSV